MTDTKVADKPEKAAPLVLPDSVSIADATSLTPPEAALASVPPVVVKAVDAALDQGVKRAELPTAEHAEAFAKAIRKYVRIHGGIFVAGLKRHDKAVHFDIRKVEPADVASEK